MALLRFNMSGEPPIKDWKAAYERLLSDYNSLQQKYEKVSLEESWRLNPDRSGGQFDYRDRGNDGWITRRDWEDNYNNGDWEPNRRY